MTNHTPLLGVNIDHVATLRQARLTNYPDPVNAALVAEHAGADSITLHLREDRRHIQENDVQMLKKVMSTPMNLEMAITDEMLFFAENIQPEFCCLVPEKREELTTEGGLDIVGKLRTTKNACSRLHDAGIRVSLFIDADKDQINAAAEAGARVIEIHTGHYADAANIAEKNIELEKIINAVDFAKSLGLQVNAGHGLSYDNVQSIAAIDDIIELNIGHSIISQSLFSGLHEAVQRMKRLMQEARP
jgi:pyridoxine 5-phosphate synthase